MEEKVEEKVEEKEGEKELHLNQLYRKYLRLSEMEIDHEVDWMEGVGQPGISLT